MDKDVLLVLIETLWNVKIILTQRLRSIESVLIETLWNVKTTVNRTFTKLLGY